MKILSIITTIILTMILGMVFEPFREFVHLVASLCVIGILTVESDDVYGLSKIRKLSKRKWRKFTKELLKESKKNSKKQKTDTQEVS